jgi:hypothetical protein
MTCIVSPERYKTKKALREAIALTPDSVNIEDPSLFNPRYFSADTIKDGQEEVVTNHPKRSWFAQVGRKSGRLYVK